MKVNKENARKLHIIYLDRQNRGAYEKLRKINPKALFITDGFYPQGDHPVIAIRQKNQRLAIRINKSGIRKAGIRVSQQLISLSQ